MTIGFTAQLMHLVKTIRAFLGLKRKDRRTVTAESWNPEEAKDINEVVETFNSLVARLCHDGNQIGELYARAERRAARLALLGETVVDSVTSGILVVDEAGDVVLANASAKRILGIEAGEEVTGRRLAGLAADSQELQTLVADALRTGANASRRRLKIDTKSGRRVRLGASTSCVSSSPAKVDAVIVVFAELGPTEEDRGGPVDMEPAGAAPDYLRGVLDCYDHFSAVVRETEKVQAKMDKGSLETSDVAGCLAFTKRSWEIMSAFALSLVARDSLTEMADVAAIMKSVLAGRKELAGIRLAAPVRDLPRVKTVRKVFEAGLELLLAGCAGDAAGRVSATVDTVQREQAEAVEIKITEGSPRSPIARIGESLRDFVAERDLRREAGLMLLRSLADGNHGVRVDQTPESLVFRIALTVPIRDGAGPAAQRGDVSEREPDGA